MAEFVAEALSLVGNFSGPCVIFLNGESITVKRYDKIEIAKWPYNCIRQFRAEEEAGRFSFVSGRRGPYGVAEYNFGLTKGMLTELQEALTQFTGAQFSSVAPGSGSGENPPPIPTSHRPLLSTPHQSSMISLTGRQLSIGSNRTDSVSSDLSHSGNDAFVSPIHTRGVHVGPRLPPRDYALPGSPQGTISPPARNEDGRYTRSPGHSHTSNSVSESRLDFPNIQPRPQSMSPPKPSQAHDHTPAPPAQPHTPTLSHDSPHHTVKRTESWIMKSQTYETSKPMIKTKPDFLKKGNKGQSPSVPATLVEKSDLVEDSESPPVPPKYVSASNIVSDGHQLQNTLRKQQTEPAISNLNKATPTAYQTTPAQSVEDKGAKPKRSPYDHLILGDESSHQPIDAPRDEATCTSITPTLPQNQDNSQPDSTCSTNEDHDCSDLDFRPRSSPQVRVRSITPEYAQHLRSVNEDNDVIVNISPTIKGRRSPDDKFRRSKTVAAFSEKVHETYDVPKKLVKQHSADEMSVPLTDTHYHIPKPTTDTAYHMPRPYDDSRNKPGYYHHPKPAEELYKVPKPHTITGNVPDTYDFPRPACLAEGDQSLYNTPRSISHTSDENFYTNVPRSSSDPTSDDTYSVPRTPTAATLNAVQGQGNSQIYNVPPRRCNRTNSPPTTGPYDTVDNAPAQQRMSLHKLRPARSFESLFTHRVNQVPSGSHVSPPELADGHNMYVDIERSHNNKPNPQTSYDRENLYAEIPEDYVPKRGQIETRMSGNKYVTAPGSSPLSSQGTLTSGSAELYDQVPRRQGSKKQRELVSQGYELCLPADSTADNMRMMTLPNRRKRSSETPPRNILRDEKLLEKYDIQLPPVRSTRPHSEADLIDTNDTSIRSSGILGSSIPTESTLPVNDEYVIITHRDTRPKFTPTQPQGIPGQDIPQPFPDSGGGSTLSSNQNATFSEEYQLMSAVKINRTHLTYDTPNPTLVANGHSKMLLVRPNSDFVQDVQYEMVNPSDFKRLNSESSLDMEGISPRNSRPFEQQRNVSHGSLGSVFSEGSEGEVQSPTDGGGGTTSTAAVTVPLKSRMRIASGSPRDLSESLDLRNRSRTFGNVLEQDSTKKPHSYVNVSKDDISISSSISDIQRRQRESTAVPKKPPMPLPRGPATKEDGESPSKGRNSYELVDINKVKGNSHPLSASQAAHTPQ